MNLLLSLQSIYSVLFAQTTETKSIITYKDMWDNKQEKFNFKKYSETVLQTNWWLISSLMIFPQNF